MVPCLLYSAYEIMIWLDREKFIHLIMRMQAAGGNSDERCIVKTRAAKALAAAVVIGGTLFATGGTSFAAGESPNGAFVHATGIGATAKAAKHDARSRAKARCQSGKVTTGSYSVTHRFTNGSWVSTYGGNCL